MSSLSLDAAGTGSKLRVAILYKRNTPIDEQVLRLLETELPKHGFEVCVDRKRQYGMEWAADIHSRLRSADVMVPLLSEDAVRSELIGFEIETAQEAAQQSGHPWALPVRLRYRGPLPHSLEGAVDPAVSVLWEGPQDDQRLVNQLLETLQKASPVKPGVRIKVTKGLRLMPRVPAPPGPGTSDNAMDSSLLLEQVGGAMPLDSTFYLVRQADADLHTALSRYDSIILIKGARQIGKTSMLARGLQYAREREAKVALTDLQKFNRSSFDSVEAFFLTLAESLADQLDLSVLPSDLWDERRGANVNFERYLRREVLTKLTVPLVWGLDEVDRLFSTSFGSEVFGLFRSWHNERALDPSGPWAGLTLLIAYATEAHLFITDMNQSPFNIGARINLEDFTLGQVEELNRRHSSPLQSTDECRRFHRLINGHPYLTRRGLHDMAAKQVSIEKLESQAASDDGIFGEHLRRILVLLAKDPALTDVVRNVLRGEPCPTPESFYRLRSAGVISGNSQRDAVPRCKLYGDYLTRHLL